MSKDLAQCNITYRRSRRAKRLSIRITPEQMVTVTLPSRASLQLAHEFVRSKQAWIQKHLAKMRQMESQRPDTPQLTQDELIQAQDTLFARLEHFSRQYKLPYASAVFRCQKTRWGSCSSQNNISLNINIAFLPPHLQDYILLHELCHVRHKNHSKRFWAQLDRYCGANAKTLAKELKTHRIKVHK